MPRAIANAAVGVNNTAILIVPNSVVYTEGLGEQNMRAATAGGGSIQVVFSDNAETKFSMVKFKVYNIPDSIALLRSWKTNQDANVVTLTAPGFNRTFLNAAITNDYEVALGADTDIEVEFKSLGAV